MGSQVADQAKLPLPPYVGGRQDREGAQVERDRQRRMLGAALAHVPPPCFLKERIEGPSVLTTSLLAPAPQKAGWWRPRSVGTASRGQSVASQANTLQ